MEIIHGQYIVRHSIADRAPAAHATEAYTKRNALIQPASSIVFYKFQLSLQVVAPNDESIFIDGHAG